MANRLAGLRRIITSLSLYIMNYYIERSSFIRDIMIEYFADGTPVECDSMRRQYFSSMKSYNDGCWKTPVHTEIPIINGRYHGAARCYYDEGMIKEIAKYTNGVKEGLGKLYDTKGNIRQINFYISNAKVIERKISEA